MYRYGRREIRVSIRSEKRQWKSLAIAAGAVVLILAPAVNAQINSNNPSQILLQCESFRNTWFTAAWPYANTLFGLLAVIEFAWSAAVMAMEKADLQSWSSALHRKIMWLGAFYALLVYPVDELNDWIASLPTGGSARVRWQHPRQARGIANA